MDLTVELRKIPATVEHQSDQPNGPIVLATTRRYAQNQILIDRDIVEVDEVEERANINGVTDVNETRPTIPVAVARQELVDITQSDEEDDDEEDDTTVENPDLEDIEERSEERGEPAGPHPLDEETASGPDSSQDRAWLDSPPPSPPPYTPEPSSRPRDRSRTFRDGIRSPSPPGYVPSFYLQNLYSPPILLRSEEEYRYLRRELIQQHNRDCLDLYYKYEFYSQQLKRARRQYY